MKKMKKIVSVALVCAMLMGMTLTANAAPICPRCGSGKVASTAQGRNCYHVTYCHAPVYFYACANCHIYQNICTGGHLQ